ncbi:sigma-54 interaction domain-containing protein [Effusibacillus dendaii]|uniref:HTH-type transcriptional regulatory protein TyrR n=1 Tax=Effusibacillus dendaii TaxID=2743772 RepID=A0A7I8D9K7_9BACL|nr:sigma 54-interacting transcriptional regulator [Effusibacillus dendaii]BCJ86838.1 RNA polymerase subunit sigma-54 [Effusibacillus dendaii]
MEQDHISYEIGLACLTGGGTVRFVNGTLRQWIEQPLHGLESDLKQLIKRKQIQDIMQAGKPKHWKVSLPGLELAIDAYPVLDSADRHLVLLTACNLLPLRRMQERLIEAQADADELNTIFENSFDGIYITDKNGITLKTNDAIERLTGIPKEYYIGKDLRYLEKRGVVQKSVTFEVMKNKKPYTSIQENALGKVILMTGSPVFNERGEVIRVVTNLRDISELNRLREELSQLRKFHAGEEPIVVASQSMERVMELARRVAHTDTTILLLGESGVGKEVVARMIHRNSSRYEKGAFIKVNCGAIPQELLESEMFGYEAGAFTGANRNGKPGMFELADEGTLFLDEIGELPLHLQVKLLRVLQEQEFHRVGGVKPIKVNVRIVAATNRDLKNMVAQGTFREDLYYRLYVVPIEIPPLRKRKEEIIPLIRFYLDKFNRKYQTSKKFTKETLQILERYNWPGNIRELANFIERLLVVSPDHVITPEHLAELPGVGDPAAAANQMPDEEAGSQPVAEQVGLQEVLERYEQEILQAAFDQHGSSYEVAKALKISQSTAIRKAYKYGIRQKGEEGPNGT